MSGLDRRLMIVSNRLPIKVSVDQGEYCITPGSGGLVTAMAPVLRNRGGVWVGWTGIADGKRDELRGVLEEVGKNAGFSYEPVSLSQKQVDEFYYGFSNEVVWPLFHDLQSQCRFDPRYWDRYQEVNQEFADVIARSSREGDFIWVQDYQLLLVGKYLKEKGVQNHNGFFLHIPFPPLDIFLKLPWRFEILKGLIEYNMVGFQTIRDQKNFIQCLKALLKDVKKLKGTGPIVEYSVCGKSVRVGTFPISIDFDEFHDVALRPEIQEASQEILEHYPGQKMILCVDRLDYTKGIPYRLEAFRNFLRRYPQHHKKWTLLMLVIPSRIEIPKYYDLKMEIDRLVGEINSQFMKDSWVPIRYQFRAMSRRELISHYLASAVALVSPIKDGMNLVAKEYVASSVDEQGVLVLSEFAGCASELYKDALLVNPYDIQGMADALEQAIEMQDAEKRFRMHRLRRQVKRHDIFRWVTSFLDASIDQELKDFPMIVEYLPEHVEQTALEALSVAP